MLGVCHGFRLRLAEGKYEDRPPKAITTGICDVGCLFWVQREDKWKGK